MHKKILYSIFLLLSIALATFLFVFFRFANDVKVQEIPKEKNDSFVDLQEKKDSVWIEKMSVIKSRDFSMPVTELLMEIDLKQVVSKKDKKYKLVISDIDRYSIFCLLQILSKNKLSYTIVKEKERSNIYVSSKEKQKLEKAVKELKDYDIESNIIEGSK